MAEYETHVDGDDVGLRAFTGALRAEEPVPVRVRRTIQLLEIRPVAAPKTPAPAPPAPPARSPPKARVPVSPKRR